LLWLEPHAHRRRCWPRSRAPTALTASWRTESSPFCSPADPGHAWHSQPGLAAQLATPWAAPC
jgi:hypothetical protein